MQVLSLNFYQAGAIAIGCYALGLWLNARCRLLRDFFIPAAVVGGLMFALLKLVLHALGIMDIVFDNVLEQFFMTLFFTSIGFAAKLSFVRSGGNKLLLLAGLLAVLIICQDTLGVTIARLVGEHPLLGVAAGSIPLVGG